MSNFGSSLSRSIRRNSSISWCLRLCLLHGTDPPEVLGWDSIEVSEIMSLQVPEVMRLNREVVAETMVKLIRETERVAETMVKLIRETERVDVGVSERVEGSSVNSTHSDMNKL